MKTTLTNSTAPAFQPCSLTITIESMEELLILRGLYGISGSVADTLQKHAYHLAGIPTMQMSGVLQECFAPLDMEMNRRKGLS